MGQKIKPTLFQLEKANDWIFKYSEKKRNEYSAYSKLCLEVKTFLFKFFKSHNLEVIDCRVFCSNETMQIFVSYNRNFKSLSSKINIKKTKKFYRLKTLELYQQRKLRRTNNSKNSTTNAFMEALFESITHFTKKRFKIFLVVEKLKSKNNQIFKNERLKKKAAASLRRYSSNNAFREGIQTMFTCTSQKEFSTFLANFIASQLKNFEKHNFFFKFIANAITVFKNSAALRFKGIKIKISGRLNGRPRARHREILVGDSISNFNFNSKVSYAESTAFTKNGTLGIKVWVSNK